MKATNNTKYAISCGKVSDNFETLKILCREEANKILSTYDIPDNGLTIPFWTTDIPELICVGKFYKDKNNKLTYELDFSQSTL